VVAELTGELRVACLRKAFGPRVVLDLDFELDPGQFALIVGENGAGKSTFLRCLLGLENHRGSVRVSEEPPHGRISGVLDQPMMYPSWTGSANMRYLLNDSAAPRSAVVSRLVGADLLRKRVGTMSTGQRKMLLLATVLAGDSPIVLLDEFANGLDRDARARFRREVRTELSQNRSFIATGHDLSVFKDLPTHVYVMRDTKLCDVTPEYRRHHDIEGIYETYVERTRP
jgi:ABC-type multidrug transport system ATPase subunit